MNSMSSLTDYYELEWKKTCPQSKSLLASWQGLALYSHSLLIVFLPVYTFTTCCILKKTPRSMSAVKLVLLNSHLWCCFVDILICSLITPYLYLPTIAGFPIGLMTAMGVPTWFQTYAGLVAIFLMGHSLTALFENRSSSIPSNLFRMTKSRTKIVYYSINCFISIVYLIPPFLHIPEQEQARISLLQKIPCPTAEFFHTDIFVLAADGFWKDYIWISTTIIIIFIIMQIAFYVLCCMYHLFFSTSLSISSKTKKYQRHFFLGTVAQVMVPLILILTPCVCLIWSVYSGYYNQELTNFLVTLFSFHGFAADVVILLVHHPYRSFIVKLIVHKRTAVKNDSNEIGNLPFVANNERMAMKKLPNLIYTLL